MSMTPQEIVSELDRHIVGQHGAKRAVAIALRNRWRRQQVPEALRGEITPKNILMIGPTGVGKTEIARRLARLADAPFIKVEATKFTEVGYVGKDVDTIVRDLVDVAIKQERERQMRTRRAAAEEGFDPDDPAIRLEALRVFAAGSPLAMDDGVNTGFFGARMAVTGPALQRVLAGVAPRLASALGQKLMAQAVPVLGAIAGAGLNAAFLGYYREVAHVRFALLRLCERHGTEQVIAAFGKAVQPARVTRA